MAGESIVMQRPDTDRLGDRGAGHYLLADDVLSLSGHIVTYYIIIVGILLPSACCAQISKAQSLSSGVPHRAININLDN